MSTIAGNMIGSYSQIGKTFILTDESGNEYTGVVTDKEVILTADASRDIREGTIAVTDEGIVEGSKRIPRYHTQHSSRVITSGSNFSIPLPDLDRYDYTALHCMLCQWNTSLNNSVAVDRVVLFDQVLPVMSVEPIANVTKNGDTKSIDLGVTNDTENTYILRYMTYKEIE